jgi:hypothetical protein
MRDISGKPAPASVRLTRDKALTTFFALMPQGRALQQPFGAGAPASCAFKVTFVEARFALPALSAFSSPTHTDAADVYLFWFFPGSLAAAASAEQHACTLPLGTTFFGAASAAGSGAAEPATSGAAEPAAGAAEAAAGSGSFIGAMLTAGGAVVAGAAFGASSFF